MKKSKIQGLKFFKKTKDVKEKSLDIILKETIEQIDNYYTSENCKPDKLINSLKYMKMYEFFNNQVVSSIALAYLSFAVTFYVEHIITNIDKIEEIFLSIKELNFFIAVFVLVMLFSILFGIFFFFFKWLTTDVLHLLNNDYIAFVLPYEKHLVVEKLKESDDTFRRMLEQSEKDA